MRDDQNILDDAFDVSDAPEAGPDANLTPDPANPAEQAPAEAPAAAEAAPQPIPGAEAPPLQPDAAQPPHMVPVDVVEQLRERVRRAEAAAEAAQPQQQPQPPPVEREPIPDPVEDPEGFQAYQERQFETIRWGSVSQVSKHLADQVHGPEKTFEAAKAYLVEAYRRGPDEGEQMMRRLRQQEHPYDYCVRWNDRRAMLSTLNPERYQAFLAWQQAQGQQPSGQPAPQAPAASPATVAAPSAPQRPPSIVSAPSAGGVSTQVVAEPLDAVFPD